MAATKTAGEKLTVVPAVIRHQNPAFSSWNTSHYSDEGECEILASYGWSYIYTIGNGGGLIVRHAGEIKIGYLSHDGSRHVVVIGRTFCDIPGMDLVPVILAMKEGTSEKVNHHSSLKVNVELDRYNHPTTASKVVIGLA